jgi:hypothetical protein
MKIRKSTRRSRYSLAVVWILAAFGLLAMGVIAGALTAGSHWSWAFPIASFAGYLLAFRRGLYVWRPEGFDGIWRLLESPGTRRRMPKLERSRRDAGGARRIRGNFPVAVAGQSPPPAGPRL